MPKFSEIVRQNLYHRREAIRENQTTVQNGATVNPWTPTPDRLAFHMPSNLPAVPTVSLLAPSKVILKFHSLLKLFLHFLSTSS